MRRRPRIEQSFRDPERPSNPLFRRLRENESVIFFEEFETKTGGRFDALDITAEVLETVASSGISDGSALVFSPHTTCCVLIGSPSQETMRALHSSMETIAPSGSYYAHDDLSIRTENLVEDEPANAPAHIFNVFAGKSSESIPIVQGELALGTGQRVMFVELDCSRLRRYCIQVIGE